jgi:hypothetical protein
MLVNSYVLWCVYDTVAFRFPWNFVWFLITFDVEWAMVTAWCEYYSCSLWLLLLYHL